MRKKMSSSVKGSLLCEPFTLLYEYKEKPLKISLSTVALIDIMNPFHATLITS